MVLTSRLSSRYQICLACYPQAFLKKRWGYCNRLRPSVTLSPPKPLDEIQPNLMCENQTLCVFSQMKNVKHIRRDFHSVPWVMPQGWDLRGYRGVGGQIFFLLEFSQIWCVSYSHEWHMQRHKFFGPSSWDPEEGPKGQISLNFNYQVNFKYF